MTETPRQLTPVTITERHRNTRSGKLETAAAASKDGAWFYNRTQDGKNDWWTEHVQTGRMALYGSLSGARAATADGSALAYLDDLEREPGHAPL